VQQQQHRVGSQVHHCQHCVTGQRLLFCGEEVSCLLQKPRQLLRQACESSSSSSGGSSSSRASVQQQQQ
jgi:hypothetical protein